MTEIWKKSVCHWGRSAVCFLEKWLLRKRGGLCIFSFSSSIQSLISTMARNHEQKTIWRCFSASILEVFLGKQDLHARWNSDRWVVSSPSDAFISSWCFYLFIYFKGIPFSPHHLKQKIIIKSFCRGSRWIRDVSLEVGWHFCSLSVSVPLPRQAANLDSSGHLIKQQSISKY